MTPQDDDRHGFFGHTLNLIFYLRFIIIILLYYNETGNKLLLTMTERESLQTKKVKNGTTKKQVGAVYLFWTIMCQRGFVQPASSDSPLLIRLSHSIYTGLFSPSLYF